jgi:hypothetical protein
MAKKKAAPSPPTAEARDEAIACLRRQVEPVTAKQLAKLLVAPFKISEVFLVPLLDEFVGGGQLNAFPPATPKGQRRYWDRDLIEFGRLQIRQLLQKKGAQPKAKLKSAAKGLNDAQFVQAFQGLIDIRQIVEHPPIGKSKTLKYGTEPPAPELYLKDLGQQLAKIVGQLIAAGTSRNELKKVVEGWLTQAGLSLEKAAEPVVALVSPATNELNLLLLMRQIEPGAERGALVTARELRRVANLDKNQFDQTVLGLARQGRLMLHRHDHASGLSASERDELVTDGLGTYYVGMALRRVEA